MIILDTDVISELMRPRSHEGVVAWVARERRDDLYTTSISIAEILFGVALLPHGRRKSALAADIERIFRNDFVHPVLAFDDSAAACYAEIRGNRSRAGKPIGTLDAQIAAIALAAGAVVATRNVPDFTGCGIEVIDPWQVR